MFFGIYSRSAPVRLAPAWLENREVIAVYEDPTSAKPSYLMWLEWTAGRISLIRDYKYGSCPSAWCMTTLGGLPVSAVNDR